MDSTGYHSLTVIEKANKFNQWMYENVKKFAVGNILEIGSGIGNISQFFIRDGYSITLSDTDEFYISQLKSKFSNKNILAIDLAHNDFAVNYKSLFQSFETIFFLNVLEHIENDELAIQNCKHLLKPGGVLIILVPAYSFLFSKMDRELHHYRRYTKKSLMKLLSKEKCRVTKAFYFNALGIIGWMYAKIFNLQKLPPKEMSFFNKLTGFAKLVDKIFLNKAGLSVIAIATPGKD